MAFTKTQQRKKEESNRLRGERDQIKSSSLLIKLRICNDLVGKKNDRKLIWQQNSINWLYTIGKSSSGI